MSRDDIFRGVAEIARQQLDWSGKLRPDSRLVEDLELDSVRLLTLAMEVEDRFRVCLDEADEASIVTVDDLVRLVEAKQGAG